jgi:hypothetical protein
VACAGRGACDGNGTCTCAPGFEGAACQRAACPAGCSGRGLCVLEYQVELGKCEPPYAVSDCATTL